MTGSSEMDEHHRKLLNMGEELRQAFLHGVARDKAVTMLNQLLLYSSSHFEQEEEWLDSCGYQSLVSHQRMHQELVQKIGDKTLALRAEQLPASSGIAVFIAECIRRHVLEEDRRAILWCRKEQRHLIAG